MPSLRTRLAVYCGLAVAGLVLILLVTRRPADPLDNPAYDALVHAHQHRVASDAVALDSSRAALVKSQHSVASTVHEYRTVRDTLNVHDTVQVNVFVARADSVVRACTDLVESCAAFRVRAESSLAGLALDRDLYKAAYEQARPGRFDRFREYALRAGLAFVAFKVGQATR